jgi:uncharacterized protein
MRICQCCLCAYIHGSRVLHVEAPSDGATVRSAPNACANCSAYDGSMTNKNVHYSSVVSERGALIEGFRSFVSAQSFPCVGAKSALHRGRIEFEVLDRLGTTNSTRILRERLTHFAACHPDPGLDPLSFVAIFQHHVVSEDGFHELLWRQLQALHEADSQAHPWASEVSDDPDSPDFSFSVASRAFFVVGMHPGSSRFARRAPQPTLVFNFHEQFEALRATGRYQKLQTAIRQRDLALQGNINPLLARFGEASEALQYSGYAGKTCPFRARSQLS